MFKKLKSFHFSSHFSPQLVYPRPLYILTYRLIPNIILNSIPSEGCPRLRSGIVKEHWNWTYFIENTYWKHEAAFTWQNTLRLSSTSCYQHQKNIINCKMIIFKFDYGQMCVDAVCGEMLWRQWDSKNCGK